MAIFEPSKVLKTVSGTEVKIIAYIGSGKRHEIYSAEYNNQIKVLVWYRDEISKTAKDRFRCNLENHVKIKNPNPIFLWPIEIVVEGDDFGYLVDYRSTEYMQASSIFDSRQQFLPTRCVVEACMKLANGLVALHVQGLGYQDLNLKNVFIGKNGDVIVNYLDNVVPLGAVPTAGSLKFTAPELCKPNGRKISKATDSYAFSVLVFMLLLKHHPLEGKRWLVPFLTDGDKRHVYIDNPVFIFDENDVSNKLSPYFQMNVISKWEKLPLYAQDFFKTAFCKGSFSEYQFRLDMKNWLVFLARLRNDVIKCDCDAEIFINNSHSAECQACGHAVNSEFIFKFAGADMVIHKETKIYNCLLGNFNTDEATECALIVSLKPDAQNVYCLQNLTDDVINATTPSGMEKSVDPQGFIPIMDGISLKIFDKTVCINKIK